MKKSFSKIAFISLVLVLFIGLIFIGCAGRGSPTTIVRQLHTAVERGDNARISELMTPEAAALALKMLQELQRAYAASGGIASMEQTITSNTAVVRVTYRNGDTDNYDLVRVDGRWRVTLAK